MNKINEHWKATSIPTSAFSNLYTKLSHKELLIVLNSLIDLFFDGEGSKCIKINIYEVIW